MAHLPPGTFHPTTTILVPTTRPVDLRTDAEIVAHILEPRPVTREKNVWAFWDNGWDAMRPWTKRNIVDWVRRLGPDWDVRLLDKVPGSPWNVRNFVDETKLPDMYWKMDGAHAGQHASDLVRCLLLYQHGGFWLDVGGILTRHLDDLWVRLASPEDPTRVIGISSGLGGQYLEDMTLANMVLGARKGEVFMAHWHAVFSRAWNTRTTSQDIREDPLFAHLARFQRPEGFPIEVTAEQLGDYLAQLYGAGRLFALEDPASDWNGPQFFADHVLLLPAEEIFMQNLLTMYNGDRQFAHLARPRAEPVVGDEQKETEDFVEKVLTNTICIKLSQGLMPFPIQLATIWDRPENHGKDIEPGTWAEYLRWASVHLDQQREVVTLTREEKYVRRPKLVWTAGLLEPITSTTPVRTNELK